MAHNPYKRVQQQQERSPPTRDIYAYDDEDFRRHEVLRAQIALKEKELNEMKNNNYQIRMKLAGRQTGGSPLRKRSPSGSPPARIDEQPFSERVEHQIDIRQQTQNKDPRERLQQHLNTISQHFNRPQSSQNHYQFDEKMKQDKIQVLMIDNASLRRRMAIVQTEVQRSSEERKQILDKLRILEMRNKTMSQEIDEGGMDPVMRNELNVMRESNYTVQKQIEQENTQRKNAQDELLNCQNQIHHEKNNSKALNLDINCRDEQIQNFINRNQQIRLEINGKINELEIIQAETENLEQDVLSKQETQSHMKFDGQKLQDSYLANQEKHNNEMRRIEDAQKSLVKQNVSQLNLMISKIIFNILEGALYNKKLTVFKEIQTYSYFDKQCNMKLKKLFIALNNHAKYLKGKSIERWFRNSLKPKSLYENNNNLALVKYQTKLKKLAFYTVFNLTNDAKNKKHIKQNAIQSIQYILLRNKRVDLRRALTIWREYDQAKYEKICKVRDIVVKRINIRKGQAFTYWKRWSHQIMWQCRVEMLKRQYIEILYKQSISTHLQISVADSKKNRIIIQGIFFHAWKDYLRFKQYHIKQQVNVLRLGKVNQQFLLQSCFDAIKQSTQSKKKELMKTAIENDVDVAIEEAAQFLETNVQAQDMKQKKQASTVVQTMLSKFIYCYFQKWKEETKKFKVDLNTKIKDRIIKVYKGKLKLVFEKWKSNMNNQKKKKKKIIMETIEQQQDTLQKEVAQIKAENDNRAQAVRSAQRKTSDKLMKKLTKRILAEGMRRWREIMQFQRNQESKADLILQRIRKNLVKQLFQRYKETVNQMKRMEVQVVRQDNLINTFERRRLLKMYQNWCAYLHNFKKQKKQLKIIFQKIINWKVLRHYKKWVAGVKRKQEQILKSQVSQSASKNADKKAMHGEYQQITEKREEILKSIKEKQLKNSQRYIKNQLVRFYDNQTGRMFRRWKNVYLMQIQKEKLIARMLQHLKKNYFDQFKAALKVHIGKEKKKERRKQIKMVEIQISEQEQIIQNNQEEANVVNERIKQNLDSSSKRPKIDPKTNMRNFTTEELSERLQNTVDIMINKTLTKDMFSKKRLVFESWRHAARQQRAFFQCIISVCSKSLMNKGLRYIAEHNIKKGKHVLLKKVIGKYFFYNYKKALISQSLGIWKYQTFHFISSQNKDVTAEYNNHVKNFTQSIVNIKDQNTNNIEKYFKRNHLRNVWKGWQQLRQLKHKKDSGNREIVSVLKAVKQKRALQKWYHRVTETKRIRTKWEQVEERKVVRVKRMIFEALQFKRGVNFDMAKILGNFERFLRTKIFEDSFKNVKSFYLSKKLATNTLKRRATYDAYSFLCQRHEKILRMYFHRYKFNVTNFDQRRARAKIIFGKINAQRRHKAFRKWREYAEREVHAQDVNETGPVTEDTFEANRTIKNLKDFMRSEGYPEEHIKEFYREVQEKTHHLLDLGIRRWKIFQDPNKRLMIKAFDHLKQLIRFRKIMRHWLIFSNNRIQPVKADMQDAFNRWRFSDVKRSNALDRYPLEYLRIRNVKQCQSLYQLANKEAESDAIIKHLSLQRDELLAHYIRGQKLALSVCMDNHIKGKGDAFRIWKELLKGASQQEEQVQLMEKVEEMTKVKEQMRAIEEENKTLANENDELRVFSMNGFEIAQNINSLSAEREKLTIDLADQASMIKKLLEENQRMKEELDAILYGKENIPQQRQQQMMQDGLKSGMSIRQRSANKQ